MELRPPALCPPSAIVLPSQPPSRLLLLAGPVIAGRLLLGAVLESPPEPAGSAKEGSGASRTDDTSGDEQGKGRPEQRDSRRPLHRRAECVSDDVGRRDIGRPWEDGLEGVVDG